MKDAAEAQENDGIDPDIRRFATIVMADYLRLADGSQPRVEDMRRIAEQVREPWRRGGPVMWRTTEMQVPTKEGEVRVRVYDPDARHPKPALIYMHGGGWTLFSLDTHDRIMREYAARAGVVVLGVDYALAPEARFPRALDQVVGVSRWLRDRGAEIGVDPDRICLGGDSAGGNLSLATALVLRDTGQDGLVKALLLIYPAVDKAVSEESLRRYGGPGAILTGEEIKWFWDNYAGDADLSGNPLACPLCARLEGLPPVCMTVGTRDVLTEQCADMAGRLRRAGVPVEAMFYPGATHSFIEAVSIAPLAERAIADGARWLSSTLAWQTGRGARTTPGT